MSSKQDPWVRLFNVSDPCLHKNGFTVYKVQSTVFPRNAPEATTKIIVWKRFNDFKKLFKSLHSLHTNLHLSGVFPSFPRSHVFGRFDPDVIEERRRSALNLLEFVAGHSPLFTSQPFLRFFEGEINAASKPAIGNRPFEDEEDGCVVLEPIKLYESPAEIGCPEVVGLRSAGELDLSIDSDEEGNSNEDEDSDIKTGSLLSLFDPLCSSEYGPAEVDASTRGTSGSNWLVAALTSTLSKVENTCAESNDLLQFPKAFADFEDDFESRDGVSPGTNNGSLGLASSSAVHDRPKDNPTVREVSSRQSSSAFDSVFDEDDDVKRIEDVEILTRPDDYVLVAAEQLKRAQDNESCGNYDIAFALYKTVVGTLLSGVREDLDCDRRDAVRRKTAQYIKRAEEIHEKYLSAPSNEKYSRSEGPFWDSISVDNCLSKLPASELGRYKVLGVVDKVLLVSDRSTDDTCVVKIVHKSSTVDQVSKRVVLPISIPFVVQLLHYHETNDAFFLVLRHAGGGKLWNYIGSYLQNGAVNSKFERGDSVTDEDAFNIYAGKKFLHDTVGNCSDSMVSLRIDSERVSISRDVTDTSLLDTKELLSKAKRLIENVTETLHESERVYGAQMPSLPSKDHRRDSETEGRRRRLKRRPSDDAFFAPNKDGSVLRRRASAGSSLELQGTRVRHFSSVFRELDVDNDANSIHLPESCVQIWAREIAAALMGLHSSGIICWDLNPDNILLDDRGHILLSYFGCLPGIDVTLDPYAKEMHYVAPELIGISQVDHSCDWWSYGALLFELLTGKTLASCHPGGFSRHTILNIPCQLSIEAESILKELLCYNPRERLGCGPEGNVSIQTHPFFSGLTWDKLKS